MPAEPRPLAAVWWLWLPLAVAALLALAARFPDFYRQVMVGELGVVESLQEILLLAGLAVALTLVRRPGARAPRLLRAWAALAALGCFYVAGEEASWGQHYFGWLTPDRWQALNDQGETNLHNISSWLDQKPRLLLELGVVLGGIVAPLAAHRIAILRRAPLALLVPSAICLPTAAIAELVRLSERALMLIDPTVYLFHRPSEVQELFFYGFVLLYLVLLRRRAGQDGSAAATPSGAGST